MSPNRNAWTIPVAIILAVTAFSLTYLFTRSSVDQPALLGHSAAYGVVFVVFAAVALFLYRSLRRSRASVDEARSKPR